MKPESRKQLLPLVLYIDGSAVSHFHDLELIPVKVSLGFWNRKTRMREHAWGILGYVEKQHVSGGAGRKMWADANHMERQDGYSSEDNSSACESLEGVGDDKRQDFHAQLDCILKGLNELIETGFLWDIKHKGVLYRDVHLIPFVPYIKCDTKEADDLCGKYQMRSGKVAQICRACKVPTDESNDHLHECEHKKVAEIKRLVQKADADGLRQCSQSYLINAFHKVRFSKGNGRGIHGACPSDMLHAILLGLFKYIRDVWFEFIGGKPKELMNALSAEYSKMFRRQSDKSMPAGSFSKGVKVGKLMGKEFRGVLLCMLVMTHSGTGRSILRSSRGKHFRADEQVQDWSHLLELLLVWEAYLNNDEMKVKHVKKLEKKHRHIMYLIRKVAPRVKGMGLKLMKFHAMLHLAEDILLFGVPLEFDTSANKSHHKPSKYAAILTQRSHATFTYQTALCLVEFVLIDLALLELDGGSTTWEHYADIMEEWEAEMRNEGAHSRGPLDTDDDEDPMDIDDEVGHANRPANRHANDAGHSEEATDLHTETGDTQIFVYLHRKMKVPVFCMGGKSKYKLETRWSDDVVQFLFDLQELLTEQLGREHELQIFTKHVRGKQAWRGHPNYRGKGHWRDWVWVDFGGDGEFCCQCWCFVIIPPIPGKRRIEYGKTWLEEGTYAVVETTKLGAPMEGERASELLMPIMKDAHIDDDGQVIWKELSLAKQTQMPSSLLSAWFWTLEVHQIDMTM